jgi:lipopolysaccharide/colanic/teichoic acid biosynthesis glycosyltransferase
LLKRAIDILLAALGLAILSPFLALAALAVRLSSPGPVFFRQERVGRGFQPFFILKFRSMVRDAPQRGAAITSGEDPRITRVGRILRATKIDELPQLVNVLRGEMSLVGPRPEVPKYVELFRADYEEILRVRPGITDLASLRYHDEAAILGQAENPEEEYVGRVLPEKIKLAKEYVARSSVLFDLRVIVATLVCLVSDRVSRSLGRRSAAETPAGGESRPLTPPSP